jgi:hypothetical protein
MVHLRTFGLTLAALFLSGSFAPSAAAATAPTLIPVTVTLAANNVTVAQGSAVILTATVTPGSAPPSTGEQNPTGTVTFYDGATAIGQSTLSPLPVDNASTATLTVQTLPAGQDSITASYAGDTVFASGTSNPLSINVQAFTLAPAASNPATNLNIVLGGSGSESFVVTGIGGYAGQVQVICQVALQDDMTCSPTPQQVTPPSTVTFAIQTFAAGGPAYAAHKAKQSGPRWPRAESIALAAFFLLAVPFGRRSRAMLSNSSRRFLMLLLLFVAFSCAGIGCSSTSVLTPNGTPLGVATLKVTATAYVDNAVTSQTLYFTVNVQPQ